MKTDERPYNDPALREAMKQQDTGATSMLAENLEQRVMDMIKDTKAASTEMARPRRLMITYKVAAVFIGLLMLSGIAYAAIQHVIKIERKPEVTILARKPDVRKVKDVYGLAVAPTKSAPVLYNNVELQQIMQYISDGYHVNIVFKNDSVRTIRFYLQWEADDTLQEIIERINHFKKVNLTLAEETIIIE